MPELTSTSSAIPSATTSAAPGTPGDTISAPAHGFLWFLIVLIIQGALLAGIAVLTRYTVQYRSGLNEPDKIRRIWARAPEIRFQPVTRPLVFAVAISYGAQTVLSALVASLLSLIGLNALHGSGLGLLISVLALGFSALISVLVYRVSGGSNWKVCAVSTFLFDWFMSGVLINLAFGLYKKGPPSISPVSLFFFIVLTFMVLLAVIQVPFFIWGAYKRVPATAQLIYNNSVVPNWVKLDRTMLVAAAPLGLVHFLMFYLEDSLRHSSYMSRVVSGLAVITLLSSCALASIISVNRALLSNEFQWQWRAFLTPAVPLAAIDLVERLLKIIFGHSSFSALLFEIPHLFLSFGSSGALGAIVYLKLAEKYAQLHIDEDVLAQDDLLAEFEEDEDNEELEV